VNTQNNTITNNFGAALKVARILTGVTQEDFDGISSRTYVSTLERGLKSPTLQKVDSLASVLGIHPLILLTFAYCKQPVESHAEQLARDMEKELSRLLSVRVEIKIGVDGGSPQD